MTWKEMIPKCFGLSDLIFRTGDTEEAHSTTMVAFARSGGVTNDEIATECREFLIIKGARLDHIQEQMVTVRKFLEGLPI